MSDCCEDKSCEVAGLKKGHASVLIAVLTLNGIMFFVEAIAGLKAHSAGLLGDSLDMFGDALAYGTSLYVLGRGPRLNAMAAALKGLIMMVLGLGVLWQVAWKVAYPALPTATTMGLVGSLALFANLVCFVLLWKSRGDDLNMRSVWLCSRNDILANIGVLGAALLVGWTGSQWPDMAVGACIAILFLHSSFGVLKASLPKLREIRA